MRSLKGWTCEADCRRVPLGRWVGQGECRPATSGTSAPSSRSGSRRSWRWGNWSSSGDAPTRPLRVYPSVLSSVPRTRPCPARSPGARRRHAPSSPNTRICRDDLITEVTRLKGDGDVPLRTMGSLSVARQLMGAGLVDRLRLVTVQLLVGVSGCEPVFADVASADLELVNHHA